MLSCAPLICAPKVEAYSVLRTSLVGSLITSEADFAAFYDTCKVEKHGIKNIVSVNVLQSFYVVVSGEVQVCLTPKDGKTAVINTFKPGELIHFFQGNSISCTGGGIINSICNLRLNLQFKSIDGPAQVIGTDRASIDRFLDERPHLSEIKRLFELRLTHFKDLPPFLQLATTQVCPRPTVAPRLMCNPLTKYLCVCLYAAGFPGTHVEASHARCW